MNRYLALLVSSGFVVYLILRDRTFRPMPSWGAWVAFCWILIIGTRPISSWLGLGVQIETPDDYLEGSPLDRMIFAGLEILGLMALSLRKNGFSRLVKSNLWIIIFFLYWAISITWSDYPFVSFKRWIKDVGHLIMIMVILSEADPGNAIRAVFSRFAYMVIPFSVVLIKYFPEFGRYYNRWTWDVAFCGVTTGKNALASTILVCTLFLIWQLIEISKNRFQAIDKIDWAARITLLIMAFWIFTIVNSSTALICLIIGIIGLLYLGLPNAKTQIWRVGSYGLFTIGFILAVLALPYIVGFVVESTGRDLTFTGRVEIWSLALSMPINPLVGTGYQGFWLGPYAERMWDVFYFHPNQAHNGYLETYLNGGIIALSILFSLIFYTGFQLKSEFLRGKNYIALLVIFFLVSLIYNITEAVFNRMDIIWFIFLTACLSQTKRTASDVHTGLTGPPLPWHSIG